MSYLMTCGDAPNCMWTHLAFPTLASVNCARHWEESIWQSGYRGLDEEDQEKGRRKGRSRLRWLDGRGGRPGLEDSTAKQSKGDHNDPGENTNEVILGVVQRKKFKKSTITMEVGGFVQVSLRIFFVENHPKIPLNQYVQIFWSSIPWHCILFVYTLLVIMIWWVFCPCQWWVSKTKSLDGVWALSKFFLDFWNLFNFAKPLTKVPL